ncbi:MAG: tyrosine-type recombinase/integrase [Clostridiales bacterium]|jgi:site-specific recombinase XerC|nr:tyrosine-type recombinase/integrase [Clostridiales bacterium]
MANAERNESCRRLFELVILNILSNADSNGWTSFHGIYDHYCEKDLPKVRLKAHAGAIGPLMEFENERACPAPGQRAAIAKAGKHDVLSGEFKDPADHFTRARRALGNSGNAVHGACKTGAFLLYSMQARGCRTLSSITEKDAMPHFHFPDGENRCGHGTAELIRRLFKCGLPWKRDECAAIPAFIPRLPRSRKILPCLKGDELARLRNYMDNSASGIAFRDEAIALALIFTGMRRGDASGMELDGIDWENDLIRIEQEKTRRPASIPLIPALGGALRGCLANERVNSGGPHIFLGAAYPRMSAPISGAAINSAVKRAFAKAGVRQGGGGRIHPHPLRRRMAAAMLESSVPQPVISSILGHASPSSAEHCLSADFVHLKARAISIKRYPAAREAFEA